MYSAEQPYVLSIAGLDPTGGAGLLADVKTFEHCGVFGFGVCTAITAQTEDECLEVQWLSEEQIITQLTPLFEHYPIAAVKLGIFPTPVLLERIIAWIRERNQECFIVWDPVLKSSSGFQLLRNSADSFYRVLSQIDLITPNAPEMEYFSTSDQIQQGATQLIDYTSVLIKGGHQEGLACVDQLFTKERVTTFTKERIQGFSKHGSGCVLSSAIAAHLALGKSLEEACRLGSEYMSDFLLSSNTKLGLHL